MSATSSASVIVGFPMNARPTSSVIARAIWLTRTTRSGVRGVTGGVMGEAGMLGLGFRQRRAESTTQLGHVLVEGVEFAPREVSGAPRRGGLTAAGQGAQPPVDPGQRGAGGGAARARQLVDELGLGDRVQRLGPADRVGEQ